MRVFWLKLSSQLLICLLTHTERLCFPYCPHSSVFRCPVAQKMARICLSLIAHENYSQGVQDKNTTSLHCEAAENKHFIPLATSLYLYQWSVCSVTQHVEFEKTILQFKGYKPCVSVQKSRFMAGWVTRNISKYHQIACTESKILPQASQIQ